MAIIVCFLAWCKHLNLYQVNTKRPVYGMLGHLEVHFGDHQVV